MGWTFSTDIGAYGAAADAFLRSRPVQHTVLLSVAERIRRQGPDAFGDRPPAYGWWTAADGTVAAACLRTPPHDLLLTSLPAGAAGPLARALAAGDPGLPGANGPGPAVEEFGAAWRDATGVRPGGREGRLLYRLDALACPAPRPGQAGRPATAADRALVGDWLVAFARATGEPAPPHPRQRADDLISYGGLSLWTARGRPVSMACRTPPLAGTVRIGPVYTPEPLRGRGYAGAVTAAVCRAAREHGAREVLLFTDPANATSNALYRRLGFRRVAEHVRLALR